MKKLRLFADANLLGPHAVRREAMGPYVYSYCHFLLVYLVILDVHNVVDLPG